MSKKPVPKLPYDVPWILQRFRALLLGREHNSALRWAKDLAPKTQPLPDLPQGPSSKIRFNYYYDRDPRGEVKSPQLLYDGETQGRKLLRTSGSAGCGPLEKGEKEEDVTSKKAGDKEEKEVSKKKEGKGNQEANIKEGDKETIKEAGEKERVTSKKEEVKGEKEASEKGREKDTTKKVGEKEEKVTSKEGGKEENVTAKKAEEKGEKMSSKTEEGNEEKEVSTKKAKTEEMDPSNAVKRVPGKVWHWDTIGGQPEKDWAKQDGHSKS